MFNCMEAYLRPLVSCHLYMAIISIHAIKYI